MMSWLFWLPYVLSLAAAFGTGYAYAAGKASRRLANGYHELSKMAAAGHIPTAEEVVVIFDSQP